jgi:hypothetical protein
VSADDPKKSTAAPSGAVVVSSRQQRWLDASAKARREGDDFAATIFAAIAQPNQQESAK